MKHYELGRKNDKESRLVLLRLLLKLMQSISVVVFQDKHFGKHATDIIIAAGASAGALEGKPMTAAKLAEYVCVPRATVVRRVDVLIKAGILEMNEKKQIFLSEAAYRRAEIALPTMKKAAVLRTSALLSKMDS